MEKHVPNLFAALWVFSFFVLLQGFSRLVRPDQRPDSAPESGNETSVSASGSGFNSGEALSGKSRIRMSARYQILITVAAMFFLGSLLLYPVFATFKLWIEDGHGTSALAAVGIFLGSLAVALGYAWKRGDLSWVKDKEEPGNS